MTTVLRRAALTCACLLGLAGQAQPAPYSHEAFQRMLSEGRTAEAVAHAGAALAETPEDAQARFALGTAQFLLAVEGLGHGLWRHGLKRGYDTGFGLGGLPFLRLPVPSNPAPQPVTYTALREILVTFQRDLAAADATLALVHAELVDLPLDLATIRLDFDGDGQGSEDERLLSVFATISPRVASPSGFLIDFDQSDAPWLRGYTHLLSAMADFLLAHDWEEMFLASFHGLFPDTEMPGSAMNFEAQRVVKAITALYDDPSYPTRYPERPPEPDRPVRDGVSWDDWQTRLRTYQNSDAYKRYLESEAYQAYERDLEKWNQIRRLESPLRYGAIADLVAALHLFSWDVVEPERMASARQHLLSMIALSRENWTRIRAETDDRREWVPSPGQVGVFRLRVTEATVANWHAFLDEFEAILEGRRLIAHWRFAERGINLRRMFDEPARFDPWLIGQGSAVLPYLEEGDLVTGSTAETMLELFGGDFFAYFIWFN